MKVAVKRVVRFLADAWWFACRWHPVSVHFRSPQMLWRMAMRRDRIRAAVLAGKARIQAEESNAESEVQT
jgi:hypothetical protein